MTVENNTTLISIAEANETLTASGQKRRKSSPWAGSIPATSPGSILRTSSTLSTGPRT
jgi:hypothetical protein